MVKKSAPSKKKRAVAAPPPKKTVSIKKTPSKTENVKEEKKSKQKIPPKSVDQKISKKENNQPEVAEIVSSPIPSSKRILTAEGWKRMQLKKRKMAKANSD